MCGECIACKQSHDCGDCDFCQVCNPFVMPWDTHLKSQKEDLITMIRTIMSFLFGYLATLHLCVFKYFLKTASSIPDLSLVSIFIMVSCGTPW